MKIKNLPAKTGIVTLASLLTACGGGSGGGSSSPPPPPSYTVGGTVSGLDSASISLTDGVDSITISPNSTTFSFPTTFASGKAYTVNIVHQPFGFTNACSLSNATGTVASVNVSNVSLVCRPAAAVVTTYAGSGQLGTVNGTLSTARFYNPVSLAIDASGDMYVGDGDSYFGDVNTLIRKITATGVVSNFVGSGVMGNANGTGAGSSFGSPAAIVIDGSGNLFVADSSNNLIRKVTPAGVVSTFAGSGAAGNADGTGTAASFYGPTGIAIDPSGNFYVSDTFNGLIRKITPDGVVSTFSGGGKSQNGTGTAVTFSYITSVATDASGNVYAADTQNDLILKITPEGIATTLAGSGYSGNSKDGTGTSASFFYPTGLSVDGAGNVYVADGSSEIRKITAAGVVTTIAGNGAQTYVNGIGTQATFCRPAKAIADAFGNVFVADTCNNVIREISPQ